jgi:hypothetical protein
MYIYLNKRNGITVKSKEPLDFEYLELVFPRDTQLKKDKIREKYVFKPREPRTISKLNNSSR